MPDEVRLLKKLLVLLVLLALLLDELDVPDELYSDDKYQFE